MQVRFKPETESRLNELAAKTGRSPADLIEDAMAGYLAEVAETRNMLATRYDDMKSGRVKPIDGEEAFSRLASNGKTSQSAKCNWAFDCYSCLIEDRPKGSGSQISVVRNHHASEW